MDRLRRGVVLIVILFFSFSVASGREDSARFTLTDFLTDSINN